MVGPAQRAAGLWAIMTTAQNVLENIDPPGRTNGSNVPRWHVFRVLMDAHRSRRPRARPVCVENARSQRRRIRLRNAEVGVTTAVIVALEIVPNVRSIGRQFEAMSSPVDAYSANRLLPPSRIPPQPFAAAASSSTHQVVRRMVDPCA